ncbi:pilus assembly protein [Marinobacter guineae]|uniref:Pilin n=1 Tax=Marinobacter guineae TaxID=432303 RepID=A0A2G1VJ39_9GAMM|nr:pilin [Marinobacter guineae]PHQ26797.1 pilus assembly protein [Marinobacter guineae]
MPGKNSGFTLIELMIVVAIIGIIASIAIPTYQGYVMQSQINRALGELSAYKSAVEERLAQNGAVTNSDIGYSPSPLTTGTVATNIATLNADGSGHLQVTMGGNAHGDLTGVVLRLERSVAGSWSCIVDTSGASNWRGRYSPSGCTVN